MDALKAELAVKRKNLDSVPPQDGRPNKYLRRGDLERLKEEQERKAKEEKAAQEREEKEKADAAKLAKGKVCSLMRLSSSWTLSTHAARRAGCPSLNQRNTVPRPSREYRVTRSVLVHDIQHLQ